MRWRWFLPVLITVLGYGLLVYERAPAQVTSEPRPAFVPPCVIADVHDGDPATCQQAIEPAGVPGTLIGMTDSTGGCGSGDGGGSTYVVCSWDGTAWVPLTVSALTAYLALTDTPANFTSRAGFALFIKQDPNGIEHNQVLHWDDSNSILEVDVDNDGMPEWVFGLLGLSAPDPGDNARGFTSPDNSVSLINPAGGSTSFGFIAGDPAARDTDTAHRFFCMGDDDNCDHTWLGANQERTSYQRRTFNNSSTPKAMSAVDASGSWQTNLGMGGALELDLPTCTAGMHFVAYTAEANTIRIDPFGSEEILPNTDAGGDAILGPATVGAMVELVCPSTGVWFVLNEVGTWADDD